MNVDYRDIFLGDLMYRNFLKCIKRSEKHEHVYVDKLQSPYEEYCDLTELIGEYNRFLKKYTDTINNILMLYKSIFENLRNTHSNDPIVEKWITDTKESLHINIIEPIQYMSINDDVTKLYVCDEIYEIFDIIQNDVVKRMKILEDIVKNHHLQTADEIYESIIKK